MFFNLHSTFLFAVIEKYIMIIIQKNLMLFPVQLQT